jgi:thiamine-monophosphate kinase
VPREQSPATVGGFSERELIARIERRLPPPPGWLLVGIGDDAAVVEPERNRIEVLSVDALVEGVHFDRAVAPPDAIGYRALAVNLSDLAAMGAAPRLALLSLVLPPHLPVGDFDEIVAGVAALAREHRVQVVGGNLTSSPGPLVLDVVVGGTVKRRQALTRGGARPGDDIYVSGTLGAAAAGLRMLGPSRTRPDVPAPPVSSSVKDTCVRRYLYPEPRVRLGTLLSRNRAASAAIDLSDGLADGVRRIAEASGVGAIIASDEIPIDPGVREWFSRQGLDAVTEVLAAGDDYELLFTVRPRTGRRLDAARRHGGAALTRIGRCTESRAVLLRDRDGDRELPGGGYDHFAGRPALAGAPGTRGGPEGTSGAGE